MYFMITPYLGDPTVQLHIFLKKALASPTPRDILMAITPKLYTELILGLQRSFLRVVIAMINMQEWGLQKLVGVAM